MDKDVKSTEKIESESTASKVDGCILKICDAINGKLECSYAPETSAMIEALASLINARATMEEKIPYESNAKETINQVSEESYEDKSR